MAKSQFEINYENALAAKDQAAKALQDANQAIINKEKEIAQAEANLGNYGTWDCQGYTFYYDPQKTQVSQLQSASAVTGCGTLYNNVWSKTADHQKGQGYADAINTAKSALAQLKTTATQAKSTYDAATAIADAAYQDWLEWKKSNMTPEELDKFLELEQKASAGALRMDAWKWAGIIVGVLALGFGVWWLMKKFRGVKVA